MISPVAPHHGNVANRWRVCRKPPSNSPKARRVRRLTRDGPDCPAIQIAVLGNDDRPSKWRALAITTQLAYAPAIQHDLKLVGRAPQCRNIGREASCQVFLSKG